MRAKLSTQTSQFGTIGVTFARECIVGEDESCTIVLGSAGLSAKHARIYFDGIQQGFFVEDLHSANGTKVNGKAVTGKERLSSGQIVSFADKIDFVFQVHSGDREEIGKGTGDRKKDDHQEEVVVQTTPLASLNQAGESKEGSQSTPTTMETIAVPSSPFQKVCFLDILTYPFKKTYKLAVGTTLIGRSQECAIELPDKGISQHHALITIEGESVTIQDLESTNHTFVNGIELHDPHELTSGDLVSFGRIEAKFVSSSVPSLR